MRLSHKALLGAKSVKDLESELDLAHEVVRMLMEGSDYDIVKGQYDLLMQYKKVREDKEK